MSKDWKLYEGVADGQILVNGERLAGRPPVGFEWGQRSGRTESALHILADCVGAELAVKHYQNFHKDKLGAAASNFTVTSDDIKWWLQAQGEKID